MRFSVEPRVLTLVLVVVVGVAVLASGSARCDPLDPSPGRPASIRPFLHLAKPFRQDLFGVHPLQITQMFLAEDGDVFVATCAFGRRDLYRFDTDGERVTINETAVHTAEFVSSRPAPLCGQIINHSDGFAYEARLENRVIQIDPATALETGFDFPTPDPVYQLTSDPRTTGLVYLAGNCRDINFGRCDVVALDTATGTTETFITLEGHAFYRGLAFDSDGSTLFLLVDRPSNLFVVEREAGGLTGRLDRTIALHQGPRDITVLESDIVVITSLFSEATTFVPGPDSFSIFAAGGFTGGTILEGDEGCFYIWQWGTRFEDGTVVGVTVNAAIELGSLVEICAPRDYRGARDWGADP